MNALVEDVSRKCSVVQSGVCVNGIGLCKLSQKSSVHKKDCPQKALFTKRTFHKPTISESQRSQN